METPESGLELPSPCSQCGYLTGILNTIPPRNPPTDLLRSHYLLSPAERTAIQTDISSSEASIQTLETELAKLQTATTLIQLRLSNLRKYANVNQALLSPWRKLPEDVLREIFYYVCDKPVNVLSKSGAVWILQRICTRWRHVVQNTPLLWCDIAAVPDDLNVQTLTGQAVVMERTEMCVRLSKSVPLFVMSFFNNPTGSAGAAHRTILKGLSTQSHRWTHVALDSNSLKALVQESRHTGPMIQPGGLPCLQELTLKRYHNVTGYHIFEGATALQHVVFEGCILPDVSAFPWTNIKQLRLTRCLIGSLTESYDIGSLFSALHNLEELQWKDNFLHLKPMLSTVTLPSLIEEDEDSPLSIRSNPGPLLSMIQMSGCKIKTLGLAMESPAAVLQVLKEAAIQDVEALFLTLNPDVEESEDVLLSLERKITTANSEASVILPSLRELTVHNLFFDYDPDTLDVYARCVKLIACSRSRAYNRRTFNDKISLVPLSSITYYLNTPAGQAEEYEDEVENVEDFGREWGVRVNFILEGKEEGTDGSGDSPSDSEDS